MWGSALKFIVIDAETYWAKDYTLSSMTPEAYIRDARFKDHGWGVMPIGGEPRWITPQQMRKMAEQYDWSNTAIICHNTRFDGAILGWHYGIKPRLWFDTMGMYRALYPYLRSHSLGNLGKHFNFGVKGDAVVDTKGKRELSSAELAALGRYCATDPDSDCRITARLFTHAIHSFPPFARMVMDMTLRMFIEPTLEVDRPTLEEFLVEHVAEKARTLEACGLDRDQVMSNDKFAAALRTLGIEPPMKVSPSNPEKRIFAFAKTDKAMAELAEHEDPQVQILVAARLSNKSTLLETRTKHVIEIGGRGKLPIPLNYWGAKTTGRHSGGDKLNMQNFTRGSILRNGIIAPPGYKIVVGDSSNIELRLVMAAAGQLDAVDKLRRGIDLYSDFATDIYGRSITKADVDERFVGKQGMLSLQYQAGAPRFSEMMRQKKHPISLEEAERVKTVYRKKHNKVVKLWYHCEEHILPAIAGGTTMQALDVNGWLLTNDMGFSLPGELGVQYKDLTKLPDGWAYQSSFGRSSIFGAQVVENGMQYLAYNVVMYQALLVQTRYRVVHSVHDELVCCVKEDEAEDCAAFMLQCLQTPPKWAGDLLPVTGEVGFADSYGKAKS